MSGKLLLCAALLATALFSQDRPSPRQNTDPQEKEFQRLTDTALAAPPELAADVFLTLVEKNAVKNRERKIELIDHAFRLAPHAKFPLKIKHYGPGHSTDSDIGVLEASFEGPGRLDSLSLRCRAVAQMLRIDKKAVLDLFQQIPSPQVPALSCKDAIGYSLEDFHALVAEIANSAFTEKEIRDSKPALFVENYVRSISSPFQIEGVAKAIVSAKVAPDDFGRLLAAFSSALKTMNADPRSFSSTIYYVDRSVFQLSEASRAKSVSSYGLVDGFRSYLVRHMAGARCAEDANARGGVGKELAGTREFFNEKLRQSAFPAAEAIPPIHPDEMKPAKIDERAAVYEFWDQSKPGDLLAGVKRLRFGLTKEQREAVQARPRTRESVANFLTIEERRDPQWEIALRDFLNDIESRRKDIGDTESNHFHMICMTYIPLIELAPPGSLQDAALGSFLEFLKQSPMQRTSPPEWLLQYSRLLGQRDGTPEGRARLLDEIKRSGDLVMNLYLELGRVTAK